MLSKLFRREEKTIPQPSSNYLIARTGQDLLQKEGRAVLIRKIKRLFSITEEVWNEHYMFAIAQFAELVQEVPASEIHHHSKSGGLIDHTLETLHAGIRISQGYVLPPNAEPEKIAASSDRWRFGAFLAILAHDIGKIVTDIEVVYRCQQSTEFKKWHPWNGNLPIGAEYIYRYREKPTNSKLGKTLHEKAGMSLLPRLLTSEATNWISEDIELLSQLFSTITHATFGGQAIAEIVRAADGASVAKNLGANTGNDVMFTSNVPLHEKLIVSLRKLIADGDLKRNKPGAALWVTEDNTWVVSKAAMEAVRAQLLNEGHKGIPKNVVRLFETLREHELIVPNPEGESIWQAEVNDFVKNWQQKLTFLRFENSILWPTSNPDKFDGEVIPVDRDGNKITTTEEKVTDSKGAGPIDHQNLSDSAHAGEGAEQTPPPAVKPQDDSPAQHQGDPQQVEPLAQQSNPGMSSIEAKDRWKYSRKVQEEVLKQNDFIAWLLKGIAKRKIRVNESRAPVHILEHHIALVTPAIFVLYLDKNSLKKRVYENRAGDKKAYIPLQREIEALDIHQRGINGQNIVKMSVMGQKRQSELKVYLLNRSCFPSLSTFSSNKVMKIHL